jgi:hypothetical protein
MKTLVLTVPHSGTHFLLRFLVGKLGLDGGSGGIEDITLAHTCDFCHIHPRTMKEVPPGVYDSVIFTLRHPHKTVQTGKWQGVPADTVQAFWDNMLVEIEKYEKKLFLVIDGPVEDRLPQLTAIAEHFGMGHKTKQIEEYASAWAPVNQTLSDDDVNAVEIATRVYEAYTQ